MADSKCGARLGMPTLIETPGIEESVALCRQLGLGFVELNMNVPAFCPEALEAAAVRRLSEESGVRFTLHLPEEADLASFHPGVRRAWLDRCLETVRWAAAAGIFLLNLHLWQGVYFSLPDRKVWLYQEHEEAFLASLAGAFSELAACAGEHGATLCVENTGHFHLPFMARAVDVLCGMEGICLTWDTGHDAAGGFHDRPVLLRYPDRIAHMHLHDCVGTSAHQVLGTGCVDVAGMLNLAAGRGICVVLETKTAAALAECVDVVCRLAPWDGGRGTGDESDGLVSPSLC